MWEPKNQRKASSEALQGNPAQRSVVLFFSSFSFSCATSITNNELWLPCIGCYTEFSKRKAKGYSYKIMSFLWLPCLWEQCNLGPFVTHRIRSSNLTVFSCADRRASCHSERATFLPLKYATDDAEVCEGRNTKENERDHGSEGLPGLQCHLTSFFVSIDRRMEVVREAEV